jgi:glycosyltransferase involved in cell wall biosynthesis
MDVLGGIAALVCGVPFVISERSCAMAYGAGWRERVRGVVARRARRIIANSEGGRRFWAERGMGDWTVVIRNALPLEELDDLSARERAGASARRHGWRIVVAGRYSAEKNHLMLLDALDVVLGERADVEVDFYGDGPLRGAVEARRDTVRAPDRVRVNGYTSRLWQELAEADLVVSLSLFEGNPNVVLESAAMGRPMVLSDIPAHREILGEDSAYFVSPHSREEIVVGLRRALTAREEAEEKGRSARSRVQALSVQAITDQYIHVYRDAVAPQ